MISGTVTVDVVPEGSERPRVVTLVAENGMRYGTRPMPVDPPGNPPPWEIEEETELTSGSESVASSTGEDEVPSASSQNGVI